MKNYLIIYLYVLLLTLTSCATGKSVVSNTADLSKYEYATLTDVMNYNGSASLMDLEVKIFDALNATRLTMIGDYRLNELSLAQKEKLLLVRFSASQSDEESVVSVNFVDYMTGRPVASCKGQFGLGLNRNGDLNGATNKVTSEIKKLFGSE